MRNDKKITLGNLTWKTPKWEKTKGPPPHKTSTITNNGLHDFSLVTLVDYSISPQTGGFALNTKSFLSRTLSLGLGIHLLYFHTLRTKKTSHIYIFTWVGRPLKNNSQGLMSA